MRPLRQILRSFRPRHKTTPGGQSLQSLLEGYRSTALLYFAAKLKIPDHLADGPRSSDELASTLKAHAPTLLRILRGLTALGICAETEDGRFELTPLGNKLRSDIGRPEYHLAILNGEEYALAWNHLLDSVKTGQTAFQSAFHQNVWEHRQREPELNGRFNAWLEHGATITGQRIAQNYDFSSAKTVADIGGGDGALLIAILQSHPTLKGILIDQPHTIATAEPRIRAAGLPSRCQFVAGNFLEGISASADVYILKSILHDWDDEKCRLILKHCHAALKSGQPLLVVERVMPERVADHPATIMSDLHMLAVTGGRERRIDEYKKLFAATGFELKRVVPLKTGHSLLEVVRA